MSTASATTGRVPSVFDYASYAFLTGVQPVTELCMVRHGQQAISRGQGPFGDVIDPPLSALADGDGGTMHDVAHPQLAGVGEGKAAPILA